MTTECWLRAAEGVQLFDPKLSFSVIIVNYLGQRCSKHSHTTYLRKVDGSAESSTLILCQRLSPCHHQDVKKARRFIFLVCNLVSGTDSAIRLLILALWQNRFTKMLMTLLNS